MKRQPTTEPAPLPAPKSLKALLREYRKTYREHGKNLRQLETATFSDAKEQLAANREAGASNDVAREAMIEAPVASLDDIATKLRFYFEVAGGRFDADGWEARIARNILRDIEKPKGASTLQELRKECVAVFRASIVADEVADKERFRVRRLHPPCPDALRLDWEINGRPLSRAVSEDEIRANGALSPEEVESRIAALREWEAACDAVDARHPTVSELQKAAEAANDRWLQLDDQFIAAPAHTLEDIGMKLEFLTIMADMKVGPDADVEDRMVFSLIRDIERMTDTKILR